MGTVRRVGTAAELAVRSAMRRAGIRFSVANKALPGSPDLANRRRRIAVFVHGCFWHRHAGCTRTTTPKRNRPFWLTKFADNIRRDRRAARALRRLGYRVRVVWECQIGNDERLVRRFAALAAATAIRSAPRIRR
jgi:DNA mismatch endonuclease (patch repair protein)